jgi:hypothetical protein
MSCMLRAGYLDRMEAELLLALELHDPERLGHCIDAGLDPGQPIRGRTPVTWLLEMYTRSERFPLCLRLLLQRGGSLDEPALGPVLLDDADALTRWLRASPERIAHRVSLPCAFTPLRDATLLHVAAEHQCLEAARALLGCGAAVDARAGLDEHGLGGHTPLFHTVNSNANRAAPLMELLLQAGADPEARIAGLVWGQGFEWETTLLDLSPIAYAQLGLLPQMHRDERDIRANLRRLLAAAGRPLPPMENVPNRYLRRPD